MNAQQVGVVGLEECVAIEHEDEFFTRCLQRLADCTACAERGFFDHVIEGQPAEGRAKVIADNVMKMANGQQHAVTSAAPKFAEKYLEKGAAADWSHGLGNAIEPGSQARAKSAGEDDRFHRGLLLRHGR